MSTDLPAVAHKCDSTPWANAGKFRYFFLGLCTWAFGSLAHAQAPATSIANPECLKSAGYFSEFYSGLHTMHTHGLKNFAPGTADAEAYFIQVQKNGEKVEMNVLKGIRGDGNLKAQARDDLIRLNQSVAKTLRTLAEQDAKNNAERDKNSVIHALVQACAGLK
jgi:hypothetical protein